MERPTYRECISITTRCSGRRLPIRSTFSLAGHVIIAIAPSKSLLSKGRVLTLLLLQSLIVTFEGHSEMITPETGYASVCLCSITRELVREKPIELSDREEGSLTTPHSWKIVFDIPVSGWLPVTSDYGDIGFEGTGTRYALYSTATYTHLMAGNCSFSLSNLFSPLFCSRKSDAPRYPVTLRRVMEPDLGLQSSPPLSTYVVEAQVVSEDVRRGRGCHPRYGGILDKVRIVARVPTAVSMTATSISLGLCLRAKGLLGSERERIRVMEFTVDVEQVEVYRFVNKHIFQLIFCNFLPEIHRAQNKSSNFLSFGNDNNPSMFLCATLVSFNCYMVLIWCLCLSGQPELGLSLFCRGTPRAVTSLEVTTEFSRVKIPLQMINGTFLTLRFPFLRNPMKQTGLVSECAASPKMDPFSSYGTSCEFQFCVSMKIQKQIKKLDIAYAFLFRCNKFI